MKNIQELIRPLRTRVANMVARGLVRLVNDSSKLQLLQLDLLDGETREACERLQEYGFTSVPLEGAEAVAVAVGGRRDHLLVLAVDDRRHRLKGLQAGEVALYRDGGKYVLLKSDRTVVATPELRLGSDSATNYVALANLVNAQLTALKTAITGAAVVAGDGGASFKAALVAALASWPASVAAGKVKAE